MAKERLTPPEEPNLILWFQGRPHRAHHGDTIREVLGGNELPADCGGRGTCGKCVVSVHPPPALFPPTAAELQLLGEDAVDRGLRLACQARIRGDVTVVRPAEMYRGKVVAGKANLAGSYPADPQVRRIFLPASPRKDTEGFRDHFTRLQAETSGLKDNKHLQASPQALAELSQQPDPAGDLTVVLHRQQGITAVWAGHRSRSWGVALDIGTTTLAAYLVDLPQGKILASRADANPQGRFGADVISRISYAGEQPHGLTHLRTLLLDKINGLIAGCLEEAGGLNEDIDEVVVVGNTIMQHIFAGLHPRSLGLWPYLPVTNRALDIRAGDLGLELHPAVNVHIFPVISGYLGGDTVAAIISQNLNRRKKSTLLIDIGTNGELVWGTQDGLWATSCATGPALEGAHLSAGMPAVAGAIEQVTINRDDLRVITRTIGGGPPQGICGSGIIDALAQMRTAGLLLADGRLREGRPGVVTDARGIGRSFTLFADTRMKRGRKIEITLADIRQVQLAKAALSAGIRLLREKTGNRPPESLIITGAFGARFNWRHAVTIGMLPKPAPKTKITVVENAAGRGAVLALVNRTKRAEAQKIARKVHILDLVAEPAFIGAFTEALNFPELEENGIALSRD